MCAMNDDGLLKLPLEAMKEIDSRRGRMSRSDFIRYLVNNQVRSQSKLKTYVTQEEFREFQEWVKSLLRSFLEFVVTFDVELGVHDDKERNQFPIDLLGDRTTDGTSANRGNSKESS